MTRGDVVMLVLLMVGSVLVVAGVALSYGIPRALIIAGLLISAAAVLIDPDRMRGKRG